MELLRHGRFLNHPIQYKRVWEKKTFAGKLEDSLEIKGGFTSKQITNSIKTAAAAVIHRVKNARPMAVYSLGPR